MTSSDRSTGFEILPGVLDASDARTIASGLERFPLERSRAGARHLMSHPLVGGLARDPRLLATASRLLGAPAVPFRATLFDKSPASNWLIVWHQDTALPIRQPREAPGWGPWSIKGGLSYAHAPAVALSRVIALRVHVDECGPGDGPLRVLPGTHTLGVLTDAQIGRLAREIQPHDCTVSAGGVVVMRPLIVHASSKNQSGRRRRVLHVEYTAELAIDDGLELAIA
jgi:ectoine hydroxylase-related dioxygenase (phytanoyl-CoA dioxygenase family)